MLSYQYSLVNQKQTLPGELYDTGAKWQDRHRHRGIGKAIAIKLGELKASVVVNYRENEKAASATISEVKKAGGKAIAIGADMGRLQHIDGFARQTALGRIGMPSDIADAVALLVSRDAGWISGENICANGGFVA